MYKESMTSYDESLWFMTKGKKFLVRLVDLSKNPTKAAVVDEDGVTYLVTCTLDQIQLGLTRTYQDGTATFELLTGET